MKSAVHHWWPRQLSALWQNDRGGLKRLRPDRRVDTIRHDNAGGQRNAHQIKFSDDSPWNTDFEADFNEVDGRWPEVVNLIEKMIENSLPVGFGPANHSFSSHAMQDSVREKISANLASLGLRSPAFRNRIRQSVSQFRANEIPSRDRLIPLNMLHSFSDFRLSLSGHGKFLALVSGGAEFIFGDGFLCNFSIPSFNFSGARMLVPLTPRIAIFYDAPPRYSGGDRFYVRDLDWEELHLVNKITQIYSGKEIFYRNAPPIVFDEFTRGDFLNLENHSNTWLDQIASDLANVRG